MTSTNVTIPGFETLTSVNPDFRRESFSISSSLPLSHTTSSLPSLSLSKCSQANAYIRRNRSLTNECRYRKKERTYGCFLSQYYGGRHVSSLYGKSETESARNSHCETKCFANSSYNTSQVLCGRERERGRDIGETGSFGKEKERERDGERETMLYMVGDTEGSEFPKMDCVDLEEGAMRAIRQAENQCREAAQKLLEAQARLESVRLIAGELGARGGGVRGGVKGGGGGELTVGGGELKVGGGGGEELRGGGGGEDKVKSDDISVIDNVTMEEDDNDDDDDSWREGVMAVQEVVRAEETRRAKLEVLERATEVLQQRLREGRMQMSINDRHIELLDRGAQYEVASWVIREVEGFYSDENGGGSLVININLELALKGCDPQTTRFLQDLPYDQVLGIKTNNTAVSTLPPTPSPSPFPSPSTPLVVDYWDGSSWESGGLAEGEWLEIDEREGKNGWKSDDYISVGGRSFGEGGEVINRESLAGPVNLDLASHGFRSSPTSTLSPLSPLTEPNLRRLEFRDGELVYANEVLTEFSEDIETRELQLSSSTSSGMMSVSKTHYSTSALSLPLPFVEKKKKPMLGKEAFFCLGISSALAGAMVATYELKSLAKDAYVLIMAFSLALLVACIVGVVSPPIPKKAREILGSRINTWQWEKESETKREMERERVVRPWEQVIVKLGAAAAVLSGATVLALFAKAVQFCGTAIVQGIVSIVPPSLDFGLIGQLAVRHWLTPAGCLISNRMLTDSLPLLISGVTWSLLVLSVGVATATVSLLLFSCTKRHGANGNVLESTKEADI